MVFDRNRSKNWTASVDVPLASDRERGKKAQNGLPFCVEGEPSAPEHLVGGLMSTSPLPSAEGILEEIALMLYDVKYEELEAEGISAPEELYELLLAGVITPEELIAEGAAAEIFSEEDAQMLLDMLNSGEGEGREGNDDSPYSYERILSILGEGTEPVILRDEKLSDTPGRYFWSGTNRWHPTLTISSTITPVGSIESRTCRMTVEENGPGKPRSVHLTDGTDVFEYFFSYDSQGRMSEISYYQYIEGRQRTDSMERQHYTFTYDAGGDLVSYQFSYDGSPSTLVTYTYDEQGRLTEQSCVSSAAGTEETQRYEYDAAGAVCRVTETYRNNSFSTKNTNNNTLTYVYEPLP